jgi:hypothetical protein
MYCPGSVSVPFRSPNPFCATLLAFLLAGVPAATHASTVSLDAADAFVPSESASLWVLDYGSNIMIGATLSEPAGAGGVTVGNVGNLEPGLGSYFFPAASTNAVAQRSFSASMPFTEFHPGFDGRLAYFTFSPPPPGVDLADPSVLWILQVQEAPGFGVPPCVDDPKEYCCVVEFLEDLYCLALGWLSPEFCGTPRSSGSAAWSETLRRYRDEFLVTTPAGNYYADLYVEHSFDLMRALVASPTLVAKISVAKDDWVAGFQALVDGAGSSFVVSQQMEDDLLSLLAQIESVASPDLATMIATERTRLQLDTIAGLTMAQYQQQVETLGGTSAVEPSSWGRVKGLFRTPQSGR